MLAITIPIAARARSEAARARIDGIAPSLRLILFGPADHTGAGFACTGRLRPATGRFGVLAPHHDIPAPRFVDPVLIDDDPESGLSVGADQGRANETDTTAEHNMTDTVEQVGISTENIICPNGMPAFLAYPAGAAKLPAIILMHERYGLVKHTKDQAIRCARDGFVVLAPNFFFEHPDQRKLNAGDSRYDLTDPQSVVYLKAAIATLKKC